MDYSKGFSAVYELAILDPVTWVETGTVEWTGGNITKDSTSSLIESAQIKATDIGNGEQWIRIYLQANQEGASDRVPLFTGLTTSPKRNIEGLFEEHELTCYSVLKPAEDILLPRGYFVPAGSNAKYVKKLLSDVYAPIVVGFDSPRLIRSIVAENRETKLSLANKVLQTIGWRITIEGDGTVNICEKAATASANFSPIENDVIEVKVTDSFDWYEVPNILRVITTTGNAIARDDRPDSIFSTVSRGREIWAEETSASLNAGESIAEYAIRRLKEFQNVHRTITYNRRFFPDIYCGDIVNLNYMQQDISGNYRVKNQKITLGYNCTVNEEVEVIE